MSAVSGLTLLLGTALGDASGGASVDVPVVLVAVDTPLPTILTSVVVAPPAVDIAVTAPAPLVLTSVVVAPPAVDVVITPLAPVLGGGVVVGVPVASIVLTPVAPSVATSVFIAVPPVSVVLTPVAPSVPLATVLYPPAAAIAVAAQVPSILASRLIDVPAVTVAVAAQVPQVSTITIVNVPAATVGVSAPIPAIRVPTAVLVPAATVTVLPRVPAVFVSGTDYGLYKGIKEPLYSLTPVLDNFPVDGGVVTVFSRRFGRTYGHFDVFADGAAPDRPGANAVIPTQRDPAVVLTETQAAALAYKVSVTFGDVTHDLFNGTGSRLYKGTILLSNGCTLQEAYQYLQWLTRHDSTEMLNGVPGWAYRRLHPSYPDTPAAPFGVFYGDTFFVAQGWLLLGVGVLEATKYRLISHDGVVQVPPQSVAITVGGLVPGDQVLVGRAGAVPVLRSEYTPVPAVAGVTQLSVLEDISQNTPPTGVIRVRGRRYTYAGVSPATKTFGGISPPLVVPVSAADDVFVPFIDAQATSATEVAVFSFVSPFEASVVVRNGAAPIVPFTTTVLVTQNGASVNVPRVADL